MLNIAIKEFLKKLAEDQELNERVIRTLDESDELDKAPAVIAIAKECGCSFTETDIGHLMDLIDDRDALSRALSLDQLECAAGGNFIEDLLRAFGEHCKKSCFAADAQVATPEGVKAIRDIREGDRVVSLNADGTQRVARVTDVMAAHRMPIIRVSFENGAVWETTDSQWFYCGGDDYACIMADGGKKALTLVGAPVGVTKVEQTGRQALVYDFVVDGLNVMFINGVAAEGYSLS